MAGATYSEWTNNTNATWYKDKGLRRMAVHIFFLYCCVFTFGYDGALLNGLQTVPRWQSDFDRPRGSDLGLIAASFYLPKIVSPYFASLIGDRYGRRVSLLIGSIISVIGAFVNTFAHAHNRGFLIAGRAVLGAGLGMQATIAPAMIQEICHPRLRGPAGAMYLSAFGLGAATAAWICFGTLGWDNSWAWRLPTLVQAFGTAGVGIYISCGLMPESPRWLVRQGKTEKALETIAKMHANGDVNDQLVQAEIEEIAAGIERDREMAQGYTAFFKTPGNRKRLLVLLVTAAAGQLNGTGLITYYLAPILRLIGITQPRQQAGINGGIQLFNFVTILCLAQFVERIGRRPLWLTGSVGILCVFAIITGLSGSFAQSRDKTVGTAVIPFLFIFYLFYNMAWACLGNLYTTEILPFSLRSKGQSIYVTMQSCALAFNQWVNPVALEAIAWKYYFVYIGVQVFLIGFAYFFYIETKGHTIEEVSRLFDGKPQMQAVSEQVQVEETDKKHSSEEYVERR